MGMMGDGGDAVGVLWLIFDFFFLRSSRKLKSSNLPIVVFFWWLECIECLVIR